MWAGVSPTSSGPCGVPPNFPFRTKAFIAPPAGSSSSWCLSAESLRKLPLAREPPLPGSSLIQWRMCGMHKICTPTPLPQAGTTVKDDGSSELPLGSSEAFMAAASQFGASLCLIPSSWTALQVLIFTLRNRLSAWKSPSQSLFLWGTQTKTPTQTIWTERGRSAP